MSYHALAYYFFTPIADPHLEVKKHKDFFKNLDVQGRIYISQSGINGQMSGALEAVEAYMAWLRRDFPGVVFKIHTIEENIFPRMTVKYRKQLVALDEPVDMALTGERLSPKQWRQKLEAKGEHFLLDVRNCYEWEIGHFEHATLPPLETFRDFSAYADQLQEQLPKTTEVLMYCTGGIRCELYSALLKKRGFEKIYQLDGGVINYGLQEGSVHWKGKLFVFDDRLAISIDGKESEPIAHCRHCGLPCDTYYNCANMDCNELFIGCPSCVESYQGCCQHSCITAPRVRPFKREGGNKPFRKKHLIS